MSRWQFEKSGVLAHYIDTSAVSDGRTTSFLHPVRYAYTTNRLFLA